MKHAPKRPPTHTLRATAHLSALLLALSAIGCVDDKAALYDETSDPALERGPSDGSEQQKPTKKPSIQTNAPNLKAAHGESWTYTLRYNELLLSPDGDLLLAEVPLPGPGKGWQRPGSVLVARHLKTGEVKTLNEIQNLRHLAFSADGESAWLLRAGGKRLSSLQLKDLKIAKTWDVDSSFTDLHVDPNGRYVVLSNLRAAPKETQDVGSPWSCQGKVQVWGEGERDKPDEVNRCHVAILDLSSGETHTFATPWPLAGLVFSEERAELALSWIAPSAEGAETTLAFYDPAQESTTGLLNLPGCAGRIHRVPGRDEILLSGERCGEQTLSWVHLGDRRLLKTLPGGTRVRISADGSTAVSWIRRETLRQRWNNQELKSPVGLVSINLTTGSWQLHDFGTSAGEGTLSQDGSWLYTFGQSEPNKKTSEPRENKDSASSLTCWHLPDGARSDLLDALHPDAFTWSCDGSELYLLADGDLLHLSAGEAEVSLLDKDLEGELLAIAPQENFLLVGRRDAPVYQCVQLSDATALDSETFDLTLPQ